MNLHSKCTSFLQIDKDTPLTKVLHSVTASDVDVRDDGDFDFSILGRGLGYKYFRMVTPSSKKRAASSNVAELKLSRALDFSNDKTFRFTIKVAIFLNKELAMYASDY